mmetsp:Transcript_15178/g.28533  ORF Transcript_15178/g.28533 Transcript_15178/m.28533 type:complete len:585 (+) Transcript_15178:58-1812(+)
MNSGKHLISTLSHHWNNNHAPTKPLFTLQRASSCSTNSSCHIGNNNQGHGVSSICFIQRTRSNYKQTETINDYDDHNDDDDSSDFETDDSESEYEYELEALHNQVRVHNLNISSRQSLHQQLSFPSAPASVNPQLHASTLDIHASVSMENIQLASTHVNGCACIWDLTKREVVQTLQDDGVVGIGPGLSIGLLPAKGCSSNSSSISQNMVRLFHQRRDDMGTISIYDLEYNAPIQKIHCLSKTFCHATASLYHEHLLLTPSEHGSFAQLWDLRIDSSKSDGTKSKSLGLIHGAKLETYGIERWNDEGMLTSLGFCDNDNGSCGANGSAEEWYMIGCGMESGKVFFHDLRMMGKNYKSNIPNTDIDGDMIATEMCSVALGKDPVLCLDMDPSYKEDCPTATKLNNVDWKYESSLASSHINVKQRSVVAIAGVAADAAEQFALDEKDRGTVAVMKATSRETIAIEYGNAKSETKMNARLRAKVGTCRLSDDVSREAKPGVGVCKFRPDGKIFAVGGWDKRIRLYSRTSAKMLAVLRGGSSIEGSVSALDWIGSNGSSRDDKEHDDGFILAAGSNDGKISIWRPPRF